jgi:hypothetical protein
VSAFDDFMGVLEAAISDPEGREVFIEYVHELTPDRQREILAEAERRDPEGSLEWSKIFDLAEAVEPDLKSNQIH